MIDLSKAKSQIAVADLHRLTNYQLKKLKKFKSDKVKPYVIPDGYTNYQLKKLKKFKSDKVKPYVIPDGYTNFVSQIIWQFQRGK